MTVQRYGWIPDVPDKVNDRIFAPMAMRLDPSGGLDPQFMPPVFNQLRLGSCTGASSARGWAEYLIFKQGQPRNLMSALFAYYNGRAREGTERSDVGAQIRDVIWGIAKYGVCAETLWPYDVTRFSVKPNDRAYRDAHFTILDSYERIDEEDGARLIHVKTALAQGWPVNFGFTVYESFESQFVAQTGLMPMPQTNEKRVGGHAVWAWQWDDSKGFRIRNSWGEDWGIHGDFWMPAEYLATAGLSDDLWVLKTVT